LGIPVGLLAGDGRSGQEMAGKAIRKLAVRGIEGMGNRG